MTSRSRRPQAQQVVRQRFEQSCRRARADFSEPAIPLRKCHLDGIASSGQVGNLLLEVDENASSRGPDGMTRRLAIFSRMQEARQFRKRESKPDGSSNEPNTFDHIVSVHAVTRGRSRHGSEETEFFIVSDRVAADLTLFCNLSNC